MSRRRRYLRYLRTLRRLSAGQWATLVGAALMTVLVRAGLSMRSLREVVRDLQRLAERVPSRRPMTPSYRRRAAWSAARVGTRLLPKRPCLTQALVTQFLLWRRGDATSSLHIGVTKGEAGELLAHAWVEHEGRVIIGGTRAPEQYQRLDGLDERIHQGPPASEAP